MANLELANLLSPATSAPSNVVMTGTGAAAEGPTATPSFFNRLLQASVAGEAATGATITGLAALSAGMPSAGRLRALPGDPAMMAPTDPSGSAATGLDLQVAASALMGTAAIDEKDSGQEDLGEDDLEIAVNTDDVGNTQAPDLTVWPGLPLFIEARAALRNNETAENSSAASITTASAVAMETTRLQFRLQPAGRSGQSSSEGRITDGLPVNPPVMTTAEGDGDPPSPLTGEIAAILSATPSGEGAEPGSVNSVASLATDRTEPAKPIEGAKPDVLKLRNPIAQLATSDQPERIEAGSLNPVAQLATSAQPERIEPKLFNPVAQLATSAQPERIEPKLFNPVAQLATSAQPEQIEPGSLNPVAQLATSAQPERIEPGPLNPVAQLATSAQPERIEPGPLNPVAQLATSAQPERIEPGPLNPVAQLATSAQPEQIEPKLFNPAAQLATSAKPERIEPGPLNPVAQLATAGKPSETATAIRDPAATASQSLKATDAQPFLPQPLIAAPFTQPGSEISQEAAPDSVEPIAPTPAGSAFPTPQTPVTLVRPDPATASTSLPTTPDVVDLNQKNWGRTLGHQLNWMVNHQLEQAAIRVNPPDLGPIELRVSLQHNQTSVTFFCHEAAVREALETALPRLREMLDGQGITLNQAQVSDQSLARQQAGGGQPSFGQRDDRSPATPPARETVVNEAEPRPSARRLRGALDDYA